MRTSVALLVATLASACSSPNKPAHVGGDGSGHFDAGTPVAVATGARVTPTTRTGAGSTAAAGGGGSVSVTLSPAKPHASDAITANATASSPNAMLRYEWSIDGQDASWGEQTLPAGRVKKNQHVRVTVTAVDLQGQVSSPGSAEAEVVDSPPTVTASGAHQAAAGGAIAFQLQATDPDGDPLTFKVTAPIAGASITPDGTLTITTSSIPAAGVTVPIEVSDPDGQRTLTSVTVGHP